MNIRFINIVNAVRVTYQVDAAQATDRVVAVARQLGYPHPVDTGIWPRDLYSMLKIVSQEYAGAQAE